MKISEAYVEVGTKLQKMNSGLDKAAQTSKAWTDKMRVRMGNLVNRGFRVVTNSVRSLVRWMKRLAIVGAAAFIAIEVKAIKAGAAMIETWNRFRVSMGTLEKAGRKWSASFSKSMRLNESEAADFVQNLHMMIKAQGIAEKKSFDMAKALVQLTYDMSSFFNLRPEDSFQKITSALMGMSRPMQNVGFIINETTSKAWALKTGLAAAGGELTEQQKVLARYGKMMEATSVVHGDLARTLNSEANQMRQVKAAWVGFLETLGEASMKGGGFANMLVGVRRLITRMSESVNDLGSAWNRVFNKIADILEDFDLKFRRTLIDWRGSWKMFETDMAKGLAYFYTLTLQPRKAEKQIDRLRELKREKDTLWEEKRYIEALKADRAGTRLYEEEEAKRRRAGRAVGVAVTDWFEGRKKKRQVATRAPLVQADLAKLGTSQAAQDFWKRQDETKQMVTEQQKANALLRELIEKNQGYAY